MASGAFIATAARLIPRAYRPVGMVSRVEEVLELPIDSALAMISDGRIVDAKTIMLLQYAALHIFR